jgi:hypothetical protein
MSEIDKKINLNLFKILEISEKNISTYTCDLCNKNSNMICIFDPCNHNCCVLCCDNLYDSYLNKEESSYKSIMFICTFCDCKIYDISYK